LSCKDKTGMEAGSSPLGESILIRLPFGTKAALRVAAIREGLTVSELIRRAIAESIAD